MGWFGLGLLLITLVLTLTSGWPTYAVVLGVSTLGAVAAALTGGLEPAWLAALPARTLGLLDHDLLQALTLYALVGALLDRLGLAGDLYAGLQARLRRPGLTTLVLGAMLAPLNGSVGASVQALARATAGPWQTAAPPVERGVSWLAAGGTLGVIVPPSIVLLLLGDAMLRAHTEGLELAARLGLPLAQAGWRVMNTQDLLQAVLLPGLAILLGWCAIAAQVRLRTAVAAATTRQRRTLLLAPPCLLALVTLVASGRVRAVEGAAAAGVGLLAWGLATRRLGWAQLRAVLDDALALTGALFGLLIAATTLSQLLRALGTDRLVQQGLQALAWPPLGLLLVVLAGLLAAATVLDAYEMIFLVVPIVMPPLLAHVGDAAWVATLALLVLQLGFLLPPVGMALLLARSQAAASCNGLALAQALAPFVVWSMMVLALVLAWPACTTWLRTAPALLERPTIDPAELERALREMAAPRSNAP